MRKLVVGTVIALIALAILIFVVPVKVSVNVSWDEPVTVVQVVEAFRRCGSATRPVRHGGKMDICVIDGKKHRCKFVWTTCERKPPPPERP